MGHMKPILYITALALAGMNLSAQAQQLDCTNPMSQVEMTGCAAQGYEAADAELNAVWPDAMAQARRMDDGMDWAPSNATLLRDAQRAWITYRDRACEAESTVMRGGTAQNMVYYGCLERLTRDRTEDLRYFAFVN